MIVFRYFHIVLTAHGVSWVINTSPQKHSPSFLLSSPTLNQQTVKASLFVNPPPLKIRYFSISFSTLTPSYLLKVTKFLVKMCWCEFAVMTGKSIFVYKLL